MGVHGISCDFNVISMVISIGFQLDFNGGSMGVPMISWDLRCPKSYAKIIQGADETVAIFQKAL